MKQPVASVLIMPLLAAATACGSSDEGGETSDPGYVIVGPNGTGPTGTGPTGTAPPTGTDPTGMDPTGMDPTGMDPTGMDPPVDQSCGLNTGYLGDENCILPPPVDEGLQFHVGPSSYDDPDVINARDAQGRYLWLMEPGTERTSCYHVVSPNTEQRYYFEQQYRMRYGSHHMIIQGSTNMTGVEGWMPCEGSLIQAIGGTQRLVEDVPPGGAVAPEDAGLGRVIEPATSLDIQLHFYNSTEELTLREVWVNFWYKPSEEVTTNLGMLGGFVYPMNVLPGETVTVGNECLQSQAIPATDPVRVVTLFGHAHTHNTRFAVWHDKIDMTSELVYDSYDGAEAPTFFYNTVVQNPAPNPEMLVTGAKSGQLLLRPGEQLRYACDITNNTTFTFTGGNEVETDEMCNLFGSVAGLGFPCFNLSGAAP